MAKKQKLSAKYAANIVYHLDDLGRRTPSLKGHMKFAEALNNHNSEDAKRDDGTDWTPQNLQETLLAFTKGGMLSEVNHRRLLRLT